MPHRIRRLIIALFIGVGVSLFTQSSTFAESAQPQLITVSPASTEILLNPGDTTTKSIDVINGGSDAFKVKISTAPYRIVGESYDPQFTQLPGTVDAASWVTVATSTATVNSLKVLNVPYTLTVPKNTAPGGYYVVIFAETTPLTTTNGSGVVSHNRVGNILYITVKGNIKQSGMLSTTPLAFLNSTSPIRIEAKISNTGGIHFITKTIYTVTDLFGKEVFTTTQEKFVLPQTVRNISAVWTPPSVIGIYTVHRSATIAGQDQMIPDERIVAVNPLFLAGLIVLIGLIIAGLVMLQRRKHHYQKK